MKEKPVMSALFALIATLLTSFLPILNKRILQDVRPALVASVVLNWGATLLSTYALEQADASLVSPLLTFNPACTLLIAWFALGEVPY